MKSRLWNCLRRYPMTLTCCTLYLLALLSGSRPLVANNIFISNCRWWALVLYGSLAIGNFAVEIYVNWAKRKREERLRHYYRELLDYYAELREADDKAGEPVTLSDLRRMAGDDGATEIVGTNAEGGIR